MSAGKYFGLLIWRSFHQLVVVVLEIIEIVILVILEPLERKHPEFADEIEILRMVFVASLVVTFVVGLLIAAYVLHSKEEKEKNALQNRLKPKLEFCGIAPSTHGYHRAMIHNLTAATIKFQAELTESKPPLEGFPLPVRLPATHGITEIGPDRRRSIDVFIDPGGTSKLQLEYVFQDSQLHIFPFDRKRRREFLISVFSDEGLAASRWYYLIPQPDGSVLLTANGCQNTGSMPSSHCS